MCNLQPPFVLQQNLLALLRSLEYNNPQSPPLGTAIRLRDEPIRLGQHPHLNFATRDVHHVMVLPEPAVNKYYVQNFGLLGPNGALPLHLSEYAYTRIHHHNDSTFSEFLDVFHHRAYLLFYRAWANAQPHIGQHGKTPNVFTTQLAAIAGHGNQSGWGRETLPDHFRLGLAGHFSRQSRSSEGFEKVLRQILGLSVRIHSFAGQWLTMPAQGRYPLGLGMVIGRRVWDIQSKVTIQIGPMPYRQYMQLLPGACGHTRLLQAANAYLGLEFDWDYTLHVSPAEVPEARLGKLGALGRNAWLGRWKKSNAASVLFSGRKPLLLDMHSQQQNTCYSPDAS